MSTLEERYYAVIDRLGGRARLVAVSKAASVDDIRALYALGQRDFAENRADQLAERIAALPTDIRWHFIGRLQSNKVPHLRKLAPLVHSFDRPDLATKWGEAPVLLQVDFTGRADRGGIPPAEVPAALDTLRAAGVPVLGLSTLPALGEDPRDAFRALRALRDAHRLTELSMGMSEDFEAAIDEGATMVRVGRALFAD